MSDYAPWADTTYGEIIEDAAKMRGRIAELEEKVEYLEIANDELNAMVDGEHVLNERLIKQLAEARKEIEKLRGRTGVYIRDGSVK